MKLKKMISLFLSLVMVFGLLAGCSSAPSSGAGTLASTPSIPDAPQSFSPAQSPEPTPSQDEAYPSAEEECEKILAQAEAAKLAILNNDETLTCTGTSYYVSNSGDDANDGLTPETAWATIDNVNTANLQRGDGIYFERGGLWRGQLRAQEGVTYSAYGMGEKPKSTPPKKTAPIPRSGRCLKAPTISGFFTRIYATAALLYSIMMKALRLRLLPGIKTDIAPLPTPHSHSTSKQSSRKT